ncbi:MAG: hypothetical protein HY678_00335 [Chloroflexi bacterium]|nr:hypothetical protein [Chloroflexota bacterium]
MEADSLRTTIRPWTSATTRVRRAAALLAMALVLLLTPGAGSASDGIYFDDSDRELLVLGSTEYYEVGLRKSNGAFAYIRDRKAGGVVSLGSEAEALWKAEIPGGPVPAVWANEYGSDGPAGNFDYGWSAERNELTLTYSALPDVPHGVTADVVLRASVGPYFDLQIAVRNGGSGTLSRVSFPHQLVFAESEMEEALLPEQPGLILQSGFFAEHRSWGNPSVFTDYLGVRTTGGSIAMYSLRSPRDFWPVHLGLAHVVEPPNLHTTQLQHMFPVVVAGNETWTSPTVRLRVSQSFLETVLAVRADNGLGAFPPVQEKLGDRYQAVARAPLFHLTAGFTDRPFREWPELLAELPAPALLVIAAYWPGGFHGYYPDILPPDPEQGTIEELRAAVVAARTRGNLVMPMVLTSWWHEDSPTMKDLPPPLTARDIAVIDELGEPVRISWTLGDRVDWGYDVSP